jgi:heme/copper-type cytochrome/quinol oxidase subunit 2
MTEATDSTLNFMTILFILLPVVVILAIVFALKERGRDNERKNAKKIN